MGGETETTVTENEYDPIMSQALANLANEQADMGRDRWEYYKQTFQPYEEEMVRFNRSMMPMIEEVTRASVIEQIQDIENNRPLKDRLRESQMEGLQYQSDALKRGSDLEKAYLAEAMKPEEERMAQAQEAAKADVQGAFGQAEAQMRRDMGRYGLDPSSAQTGSAMRTGSLAKAAALAGAATNTTRAVQNETFGRLAQAQQLQKGMGFSTLGGVGSAAATAAQTSLGGYGLDNPLNSAAQMYSGAQAGISSLANRVESTTSTKTTQQDPMAMIGNMAGAVGGKVLGAYTGGMLGG